MNVLVLVEEGYPNGKLQQTRGTVAFPMECLVDTVVVNARGRKGAVSGNAGSESDLLLYTSAAMLESLNQKPTFPKPQIHNKPEDIANTTIEQGGKCICS